MEGIYNSSWTEFFLDIVGYIGLENQYIYIVICD